MAARTDLPQDLRPVTRGLEHVRVTELDAGVSCLRLPLPYAAMPSVNAYLLGGHCLVDCGTSLDPGWQVLEHALALAGARPEDIRTLVCTHPHADHAGLAAALVARTGCELLRGLGPHTIDDVLRDPATPLETRRRRGLREGIPADELDRWVDAHLCDDVRHERPTPDGLLAPGDALEAGGRWRVVRAPGHSPAQIALFEERRGWAITADLAYDVAEPFLEYGWTPDPYGEHLASLERVAALEPTLLLPGHGRPVPGAAERLEVARRRAEALAPLFLAALADGPRSAYEVVVGLVPDAEEYNRRQSMLSIALCVFEHLVALGVVGGRVGDDGVRRFALG